PFTSFSKFWSVTEKLSGIFLMATADFFTVFKSSLFYLSLYHQRGRWRQQRPSFFILIFSIPDFRGIKRLSDFRISYLLVKTLFVSSSKSSLSSWRIFSWMEYRPE